MALSPTALKQIRTIVREEIDVHRKETKKGFTHLEKKLDKSFDYLDKQDLALGKRVRRLEDHIGLSSPTL